MKNLLRGSLLTLIFVGMSGFNSSNVTNAKSTIALEEDPGRVGRDCADEANRAATQMQNVHAQFQSETIINIWMDIYFGCVKETGGLKFK
jgi:hypothetical protein